VSPKCGRKILRRDIKELRCWKGSRGSHRAVLDQGVSRERIGGRSNRIIFRGRAKYRRESHRSTADLELFIVVTRVRYIVQAAWKGYFRLNGVKSQALLSHFALQCFNISLCLCCPWPTGRGRAARPDAWITLNEGEGECIFPHTARIKARLMIFNAIRVQWPWSRCQSRRSMYPRQIQTPFRRRTRRPGAAALFLDLDGSFGFVQFFCSLFAVILSSCSE